MVFAISKKIIITDSYRNDEDALEGIDDYIHKVIRHEAFHAFFAEMGIKKWLHDEELIDTYEKYSERLDELKDKYWDEYIDFLIEGFAWEWAQGEYDNLLFRYKSRQFELGDYSPSLFYKKEDNNGNNRYNFRKNDRKT